MKLIDLVLFVWKLMLIISRAVTTYMNAGLISCCSIPAWLIRVVPLQGNNTKLRPNKTAKTELVILLN